LAEPGPWFCQPAARSRAVGGGCRAWVPPRAVGGGGRSPRPTRGGQHERQRRRLAKGTQGPFDMRRAGKGVAGRSLLLQIGTGDPPGRPYGRWGLAKTGTGPGATARPEGKMGTAPAARAHSSGTVPIFRGQSPFSAGEAHERPSGSPLREATLGENQRLPTPPYLLSTVYHLPSTALHTYSIVLGGLGVRS